MAVYCTTCGANDFRISHFRLLDAIPLIGLRYPIRCRRCEQRTYCSVWRAWGMRHERRKRHRAAAAQVTRTPQ